MPHHAGIGFDVLQYLQIAQSNTTPACMNFDWPHGLRVLDSVPVDDIDFVLTGRGETVGRHDDASIVLTLLGERAQIRDGMLEVDLR